MTDHGFESIGDVLKRLGVALPDGPVAAEDRAPDPTCSRCRDAGFLRRNVHSEHPDFGRVIECPCGLVVRRRSSRIWEMSQVPASMRGYTLDSFLAHPKNADKAQLAADVADAWTGTDRWMLFVGPVGVGKTGLAVSLLMDAIRTDLSGLYVVTPTFLSRIRATYTRVKDGEVDEQDVLASVIEAHVLVLDDLGKVALSEWGQEKLFTVVNERYIRGRRTIVTSNLDTQDGTLEEHLWAATFDRIRGMSEVFRLTGESLR